MIAACLCLHQGAIDRRAQSSAGFEWPAALRRARGSPASAPECGTCWQAPGPAWPRRSGSAAGPAAPSTARVHRAAPATAVGSAPRGSKPTRAGWCHQCRAVAPFATTKAARPGRLRDGARQVHHAHPVDLADVRIGSRRLASCLGLGNCGYRIAHRVSSRARHWVRHRAPPAFCFPGSLASPSAPSDFARPCPMFRSAISSSLQPSGAPLPTSCLPAHPCFGA